MDNGLNKYLNELRHMNEKDFLSKMNVPIPHHVLNEKRSYNNTS